VNINFNTASVGERVLAYLLDVVVWISYVIVIGVIFKTLNIDDAVDALDTWSQMAIYGLLYLPVMLYTLVLESTMEGQTIGKKIMKIKVIKIDGYQAGFGDYLIRWLFRIVEVTGMPQGIIGIITMSVNKKNQRLGDMAAGTALISLKSDVTINHTILREIGTNYVPTYPLVIRLSDNDVRIIKETYESSYSATDFDMIAKLQTKIETVTGIKSVNSNATAFVDTILKDYNYYTQSM